MRRPLVGRREGWRGPSVLQTCPVRGLVMDPDQQRLDAAVRASIDAYRQLSLARQVARIRKTADSDPAEGLDIRTIDEVEGDKDRN